MDSDRDSLDRVVVVGTSGSGKTTFARTFAARTGCTHIELDAVHWLPDWQERPKEETREIISKAAAGERWVTDGNYGRLRDILWKRATAVVWLNYSFPQTFGRVLRRTVTRAWTKEELFSGNRESFRQSFLSRNSILLWVFQTYWKHRKEYRQILDSVEYAPIRALEFRHPREADAFLANLRP